VLATAASFLREPSSFWPSQHHRDSRPKLATWPAKTRLDWSALVRAPIGCEQTWIRGWLKTSAGTRFNIALRPNSNRRRLGYTVPPFGNCGGSHLESCPRWCAGAPLWYDRWLPSVKVARSSRRDVALKPVDLQEQSMEIREMNLGKERARLRWERAWLRGWPMPWRRRSAAAWTVMARQPAETGLEWGTSAAPQLPVIGWGSAYRRENLPTTMPNPRAGGRC